MNSTTSIEWLIISLSPVDINCILSWLNVIWYICCQYIPRDCNEAASLLGVFLLSETNYQSNNTKIVSI